MGFGKTFIAGEIMDLYLKRRQRCLLIRPAQLRDTIWKKFRSHYYLGDVECVSYEELAIDRQIALRRSGAVPGQAADARSRSTSSSSSTRLTTTAIPTRRRARRFCASCCGASGATCCCLTATPVNNSLWDLYHLLRFFARQDAFLANRGVLSIKERFDKAAHEDPAALSPDVLYPIIDATTVKRTRQFIKKHYGGDTIKLPDGRTAAIIFPTPQTLTRRYPGDRRALATRST